MEQRPQFEPIKRYILERINLSDKEWELVQSYLRPKQVAKKVFLLQTGEVCKEVAFITKGCFRYFYATEKGEMTGHIFFEGEFVADYQSFLTQQPSLVTIQALEASELLCLSYQDMQTFYEVIPAWQRMGRLIAESVYSCAQKRTATLLLDTPEARYTNLLKEHPDIFTRVSQYVIASYLGVTPETLSRIKKRLS
jgi:CRP/FNR family transcriptional regulator, anaerobic regulatory protein